MSKTTRYILFIGYLLISVFLIFGGLVLQDYAKTPFWWNFWTISPYIGVAAFIYGVFGLPKKLLPKSE